VIKYAKEHDNRAAERHFGPSPTEKVIHKWKKLGEKLQQVEKNKHFPYTYCKVA
jgi:hypothetical protein